MNRPFSEGLVSPTIGGIAKPERVGQAGLAIPIWLTNPYGV